MTGLESEQPAAAQPEQQLVTRRARRAAKREARWTRPKPPHDWRFWVGGTGRVFIVTGLLMFGFVAYQLWGTGIEYARAQDRLDDELEELFAGATTTSAAPTTTTVVTTTPGTAGPTTAAPTTTTTVPATVPVPAFDPGQALARLEIPRIGVNTAVVSGVSAGDLKKGPGHYPDTPMPGQLGNAAIAGHRTTYGQPFFDLDDVEPGDEIVVTTVQGRFVYRITGSEIVGAGDSQVVATADPTTAKLTLTTCHPKYTARERLIVYADLDTEQSGPGLPPVVRADARPPSTLPGEPTAPGTTSPITGDDPTVTSTPSSSPATTDASAPTSEPAGTTEPGTATTVPVRDDAGQDPAGEADDESADAFSHGWFSDTAAWPQVAMWGAATALVAIGGWLLARRFRRYWVGAVVAIVPFVVALFFFYQNVNRLLPAAL